MAISLLFIGCDAPKLIKLEPPKKIIFEFTYNETDDKVEVDGKVYEKLMEDILFLWEQSNECTKMKSGVI